MTDNNGDSFKFVDRRRVDAEGKDREAEAKGSDFKADKNSGGEVHNNSQNKTQVKSQGQAGGVTHSEESNLPIEIGFSEFIMSFATQALMQLGHMQPPPGVNLPKDVRGMSASQRIFLSMQLLLQC